MLHHTIQNYKKMVSCVYLLRRKPGCFASVLRCVWSLHRFAAAIWNLKLQWWEAIRICEATAVSWHWGMMIHCLRELGIKGTLSIEWCALSCAWSVLLDKLTAAQLVDRENKQNLLSLIKAVLTLIKHKISLEITGWCLQGVCLVFCYS